MRLRFHWFLAIRRLSWQHLHDFPRASIPQTQMDYKPFLFVRNPIELIHSHSSCYSTSFWIQQTQYDFSNLMHSRNRCTSCESTQRLLFCVPTVVARFTFRGNNSVWFDRHTLVENRNFKANSVGACHVFKIPIELFVGPGVCNSPKLIRFSWVEFPKGVFDRELSVYVVRIVG